MNKTKVMQILNSIDLGLNIIEEGQQLDTIIPKSTSTDGTQFDTDL